jgi:hypothetical protein
VFQTVAKQNQIIVEHSLFIRPGVNCLLKNCEKAHCVVSVFLSEIPEVKFLRNCRNLTADDTAPLCRNQRDALGEKSSQAGDAFGLVHAILRAKARNSDFPRKLFRGT